MIKLISILVLLMALPATSFAQGLPLKEIPTYKSPDEINLPTPKTGNAPENWETLGGSDRIVRNVTQATLTPVLPDPAKATGAAIIVVPGGAFMMLSIDNEGYKVAHWLADRGIAAFVLKYRLTPTAPDPQGFGKQFVTRMAAIIAESKQTTSANSSPSVDVAVVDATAALKYVRQNANAFGIDPGRVGMVGFSAGGRTALGVTLLPDATDRPNFSAIIYGPMGSVPVPADAPPAFFAVASDDPLYGGQSGLFESWRAAKRSAELHRFEHGGHGFGLMHMGTTSDHWIDEFYWWLEAHRLTKPKGN